MMITPTKTQQYEKMSEESQQMMAMAEEEAEEIVKESEKAIRHRRIPDVLAIPEKAPNPFYLGMAAGSVVISLILFGFKKKEEAIFVGHWAPTLLALGLFAKLVSKKDREIAK